MEDEEYARKLALELNPILKELPQYKLKDQIMNKDSCQICVKILFDPLAPKRETYTLYNCKHVFH